MNSRDASTAVCVGQSLSNILQAYNLRNFSTSQPPTLSQTPSPSHLPQAPSPSTIPRPTPPTTILQTSSTIKMIPIPTRPPTPPLITVSRSPSLISLSRSPSPPMLLITPPLSKQLSSSPTLPIPTPPPPTLPKKHSIRFIFNDQNNYREKYTGQFWKLVCTWNHNECDNFASSNKLCKKHNTQQKHELLALNSLPLYSAISNIINQTVNNNSCTKSSIEVKQNNPIVNHTDTTSKSEYSHFKQFSIESDDDSITIEDVRSVSDTLSNSHPSPSVDFGHNNSKPASYDSQITELLSKNIPPLTCFEEIYLGNLLMQNCPQICSMLDAQLYLHDQAIQIVKRNYHLQMKTISSEYFYDFLLRQPHIATHYKYWFSRYHRIPQTTDSSIDNKIRTLSMLVRFT